MQSRICRGLLAIAVLPVFACASTKTSPPEDGGAVADSGPSMDAGATCPQAPQGVTAPNYLIVQGADPTTGAVAQDLAQLVTVPQTGQPGQAFLILKRLSKSTSSSSHDLLIDLYPAASPMPPLPECASTAPIAHARYDLSLLTFNGIPQDDSSVVYATISFISAPNTTLNAGDTVVMHVYLSAEAIDEIGVRTTAGLPPQTPLPMMAVGTTTFARALPSADTCACAPQWASTSDPAWNGFTIGNGCTEGATKTCGQGICQRTTPMCDSYGNYIACRPGACATDADCCPKSPAPRKISIDCSTYTCNTAVGICNPHAEVCDGLDNDCNGTTDDGLATLQCDGGCSVSSCGDDGTPAQCPASCSDLDGGQ